MKELTIEEKAKRYDEALERCRKLYNGAKDRGETYEPERFETIFPELKESEDERIKKVIKQVLYESTTEKDECYLDNRVTQQEVFAWLEKHGEQKAYTLEQAANIFLNALSNSPYNNKPITDAQTITKQLLNFLQNPASYNPDALITNEQKPADEVGNYDHKEVLQTIINAQKPAWSEDDEEMFDAVIADIQFTQKAHNHEVNQIVYEREIDFLNSLKNRFTWKPSDEQMKALEVMLTVSPQSPAITSALIELYEQLKKLREE